VDVRRPATGPPGDLKRLHDRDSKFSRAFDGDDVGWSCVASQIFHRTIVSNGTSTSAAAGPWGA
jgi:hypothetical protein